MSSLRSFGESWWVVVIKKIIIKPCNFLLGMSRYVNACFNFVLFWSTRAAEFKQNNYIENGL